MGLMKDEDVWKRTLIEGKEILNPREMRSLFVQILLYGNLSNSLDLWNEFKDHFIDHRNVTNVYTKLDRIQRALRLIQSTNTLWKLL